MISFNEIERLRIGLQFGIARDLARELVRMLSVKGGHCASDLLLGLEQCAAYARGQWDGIVSDVRYIERLATAMQLPPYCMFL